MRREERNERERADLIPSGQRQWYESKGLARDLPGGGGQGRERERKEILTSKWIFDRSRGSHHSRR